MSSDLKPVVQLKNVTKKIGSKIIIDNLTFDVPKGEVFGFLGPNGAGKTTTIRMMVGLMSLTNGEVLINGYDIKKEFEKAIRHVGAIVENPEMYKYMSGYLNLVHYSRMIPGITKERIREVIELVGLEKRIHDKVKSYSLGMRQRLGVAQALLHKPSLLILDEPTNGLDPAGIRELRDYFRKLTREEGISIIVSSHLLSEMELMCDRVAIIQNGRLIDVKTLKEFVTTPDQMVRMMIEVDEPNMAVIVAEELGLQVEISNEYIVVQLERDKVPVLNKSLVEANVQVFELRTMTQTLEDKFLEMTGGEQIV